MDNEYRWPKKGDNPFLVKAADHNSPTWASLHWLASLNVDDSFYALAFKEAGDKIVDELSHSNTYKHADMYFMPIAYLYRHSMELKMKEIIRHGISLELIIKNENTSEILKDHNLHQLWNCVEKVVKAYWPDGSKNDIDAAGRIVQEFHKIDKSGQILRYSKDLSGISTLEKLPESVQLTHLRDVFEAVFNFFNGCEAGLHDAIDIRNEMIGYYGEDFS